MVRTCLLAGVWVCGKGYGAIELNSHSGVGSQQRARNSRLRSLFIKGWFSGLLHMAGHIGTWSKVHQPGAMGGWLHPSLPLHQAMHPSPGGGCLLIPKVPEPDSVVTSFLYQTCWPLAPRWQTSPSLHLAVKVLPSPAPHLGPQLPS